MAARALHRRAAHHTRAMQVSARPFRKPGRRRERRRRAGRSLPPERRLHARAQTAARPSRARGPFESRRRWRRTARRDQAAARAQQGREFEALRSWNCREFSIRQLGFGLGQGWIVTDLRRAQRCCARTNARTTAKEGEGGLKSAPTNTPTNTPTNAVTNTVAPL